MCQSDLPTVRILISGFGFVFFLCLSLVIPSFHDFLGQIHNIEIVSGEW